jgi:hypothetical protein
MRATLVLRQFRIDATQGELVRQAEQKELRFETGLVQKLIDGIVAPRVHLNAVGLVVLSGRIPEGEGFGGLATKQA